MYPHKLEVQCLSSTLKDRVDKGHDEITYPFLHDVMFSSFPVPNIFIDFGILQEPNGKENCSKGDSSYYMTWSIVYSTFSVLGYFCSVISPGNILPRGGPRVQPLQPGDARLQGCAGLRVGQEVRPRPGQRVGHGEEDSGGGVRGCLQPASARDFLPQ